MPCSQYLLSICLLFRSLLCDFGDSYSNSPGSEALVTLIITLLRPYNAASTKWEMVVDLSQAPAGVLFKVFFLYINCNNSNNVSFFRAISCTKYRLSLKLCFQTYQQYTFINVRHW